MKLIGIIFIFLYLNVIPIFAQKYQIGISYTLPKAQKLELKIVQVPQKYPWIERDLDGSISTPEKDCVIIAQNTKPITLKDAYGKDFVLPTGTRFYAKVSEKIEAKNFWRKEKVKLKFFQIAIPDPKEFQEQDSLAAYDGEQYVRLDSDPNESQIIDVKDNLNFDSKKGQGLQNLAENLGRTGAYALTGAIAGPLALFSVSSLIGIGSLTNPYVIGGAAALGGSLGLAYGIVSKGNKIKLEPGKTLKITLEDPWQITKEFDKKDFFAKKSQEQTEMKTTENFKLEILEIKKTHDLFDDPCLKIKINYENLSKEKLSYTSFQLIDSMGKTYEPGPNSIDESFLDNLPKKGNLDLFFAVDFPNTLHQLKVLRTSDRKPLAYANVLLK